MKSIKRRKIDITIEKKIATAMIVSTDFLSVVAKRVEPKNFKIDYVKKIVFQIILSQ